MENTTTSDGTETMLALSQEQLEEGENHEPCSSRKPLSFLDLPPEIRNAIYELLAESEGKAQRNPIFVDDNSPKTTNASVATRLVAFSGHFDTLFNTHPQIERECVALVLRRNPVILRGRPSFAAFLTDIGPLGRGALTTLALSHTVLDSAADIARACRLAQSHLPSLARFDISTHILDRRAASSSFQPATLPPAPRATRNRYSSAPGRHACVVGSIFYALPHDCRLCGGVIRLTADADPNLPPSACDACDKHDEKVAAAVQLGDYMILTEKSTQPKRLFTMNMRCWPACDAADGRKSGRDTGAMKKGRTFGGFFSTHKCGSLLCAVVGELDALSSPSR